MRDKAAILALLLMLGLATTAYSQAPRLMRYSGVVHDASGTPRTGVVNLAFRLYGEAEGSTPLVVEAQNVILDTEGRYTVVLGATFPEGLPLEVFASGTARWLGVQADGDAEAPRVMLVSVPYALKAADADTVGGKPASAFVLADSATQSTVTTTQVVSALSSGTTGYLGVFTNSTDLGNSVAYQSGTRLGVGTTAPAAPFHSVAAETPGTFFDVYSNTLGALPVVFRAARGTPEAPLAVQTGDILGGLAVRGYGTTGFAGGKGQVMFRAAENWTDAATGTYLQMTTTPIGSTTFEERMRITPNGNIGIGIASPAQKLSVAGTIESTSGGFMFPDGTTQTTAAGGGLSSITAGGGITVSGSGSTQTVGVNFAGSSGDFGTSSTVSRGDHAHDARYLRLTGGTLSNGIAISTSSSNGVSVNTSSSVYPGIFVSNTSAGGHGVYSVSDTTSARAVEGRSAAGVGVYGSTSTGYAGLFSGRVGIANASGTALEIIQVAGAGNGINIYTSSLNAGIFAETVNTGFATAIAGRANAATAAGVSGRSTAGWGVSGVTSSGYGVYAQADSGWAGWFNGWVNVSGGLTKGGGAFKIDHPLDPENKYLYHSFVESPDMKNIYDGVVLLDELGEAWVSMPDWFEALNRDFRYQLTPIGASMQLYVAEELSGNSFKIGGGIAGKRVSWQITGIRQDAFANANRIPTEELKPADEQGLFLHPEAFRQPKEKGVGEKRGTLVKRPNAVKRP